MSLLKTSSWGGRVRFPTCVLVGCISVAAVNPTRAQSTTAQLSGTIYDEQRRVVADATVVIGSPATGQTLTLAVDSTGRFRAVGLVPGTYEVEVRHEGFKNLPRTITLAVGEVTDIDLTLMVGISQELDVIAEKHPEATSPRRVFTTSDIDGLPVVGRDFTNLALLVPGILQNQVGTGSSTGITASGQTGRNNIYLIDGMTLDDSQLGNTRGGLSLDTVREFVVLSNGFSAEYGQASGAVVSVVTRSGTNQLVGRAFYDHRDDAWDATPHEARLVTPPLEQAPYEQKIVGAFLGGPVVRNRMFYFGSLEYTRLDTEAIITSPLLQTFEEGAEAHLPSPQRTAQAFARADIRVGSSGSLSPRARVQRVSTGNVFLPVDVGIAAPERANDVVSVNSDGGVVHNLVWGATRLNEFRGQFARRNFDRASHCPGCPAEEHPSFKLGKSSAVPNGATEERWQFADSLTANLANAIGEHTFKAGAEISLIAVSARGLADRDGTFTFNSDEPFDATRRETYPARYTQTFGNPDVQVSHSVYAGFLQDRWRVGGATLEAGARWDYDDAPGASRDMANVAPRLSVAFDPARTGRTVFRGGYGLYYDQIPLSIAIAALQAQSSVQIFVRNPDYRSHTNPNGRIELPPNTSRLLDLNVPVTEQFTVGFTHVYSPALVVAADIVKSRGQHLFVTRDLNYPRFDLPSSPRPDPQYQRVTAVDSIGHSWYRALQIGAEGRAGQSLSWSLAYTWSLSERDTEDHSFSPQDQTNPQAERGPAANDTRHRLAVTAQSRLRWGLRLSPVVALQSALPYTITLGKDANGDGVNNNDRPPGVDRNSARGGGFIQIDMRLAKSFRQRDHTIEAIVESFNVANRANWTGDDGKLNSPTFGGPTKAAASRQIQAGVRFDF